ncbi:hypothetical protein ACF3MZ_07150 [Paenibacillaceae bacterium WGS1546]|uniref:hypothetical protein n=1 Tax=Cohnella sp. WGS1546 TaxID=3366810 RepID=UPI00372D3E6B
MNEEQAKGTIRRPDEEAIADPVELGMTTIQGELAELRAGAHHLMKRYGDAAETSDLTFIKILEERYARLHREIQAINEEIEAWTKEEKAQEEAIEVGG